MTTLYVSDLDGTLLNSEKHVSQYTMDTINSLIENGMLFTIATARTLAATTPVLSRLKINIPIILMNGVMVYDPIKKDYIYTESIAHKSYKNLIDILNEANKSAFIFTLGSDKDKDKDKNDDGDKDKDKDDLYTNAALFNVYHGELIEECECRFYNTRVKHNDKNFIKTEKLELPSHEKIIYIATLGEFDKLVPIFKQFQQVEGVTSFLCKDDYAQSDYYLEAFSSKASKNTGVQYLKQLTGADKVITFGDNFNDIDMLINADESYAVSNACDEVKKIVSGIIESNNDDGVAKFLSFNSF